ncbi:hypothetical protein M409DRAFT_27736 [Zasmidium cellare ATCC 36951]|uniref:F-box domain-containing protein n=1 Tax=Zasmidium cellare ATCC 36951 TaxID=1080233 RepID=A0A6A6C4Q5_ZASCE|nr:uncharacterized protein M409DRAFT_27736 [Zasmidium cellare ATCC 36951]KAF2162011.1 hypothetical protein M409DRAFT_27736 [Zasmidium cellare ATCC 36951]
MPFDPTPRKHSKLTPLDIGKMQVISINDFDRAQEAQLEYIMDSAVDQLEGFNKPAAERLTVADVVICFGQLRLHDELPPQFRFDFAPPTTCRQWPGPRFGSFSLHKPLPSTGKTKAKSSKCSKQSKKHAQPDDFKQSIRPQKAPKPKKTKKVDVAPVLISTKTSRHPPLELMSLPPELRNAIWSLLAVHDEPIEVQLRPIRPCKRPKELRGAIIRRFPLEPVVASVSRQVRREVLSIFYGDNRFILQKNACNLYNGRHMTDPTIMEKWLPRQNTAKFLTHLDIRFNTVPRTFRSMTTVYTLRRLPDDSITIKVKVERALGKTLSQTSQPCLCHEQEIVSAMEDSAQRDGNLLDMAVALTRKRREMLFGGVDWKRGIVSLYTIKERTCEKCKKETFETVYSS